ncbi:11566_t:CDS:2, partial [Funneliformis caledonium]
METKNRDFIVPHPSPHACAATIGKSDKDLPTPKIIKDLNNSFARESKTKLHNPNLKDELISSEEIQNEQQTDNLDKIKIHGILKKEILVESNVKSIIDKDNSNDDDVLTEGIMDLTHKSHFVRQLPEDVYKSFLESLNQYDQLIPATVEFTARKVSVISQNARDALFIA